MDYYIYSLSEKEKVYNTDSNITDMKKISLLLFVLMGYFLSGCWQEKLVDKYEIGDKLTLNQCKQSNEIYFTKKYLVFKMTFTHDFKSDVYLFFYDKNLRLYGKVYPKGFVGIEKDTALFTNDMNSSNFSSFPKGFIFKKINRNEITGSITKSDKVLTGFTLNQKTKRINLQIKKISSDSSIHQIFQTNNITLPISDSIIASRFTLYDTLSFPLSDLYFEGNTIRSGKEIYKGMYEIDEIYYQNNTTKEKLYNEIWKLILDWK